ncbi:MAG: type II toxin-antitoxin system RelE family toxin [Nanoarchaeota archaeon]
MDIIFSNNSKKKLKKLNVRIRQKILFTLDKFQKGFSVDIVKLKGSDNEFRIRTGNYRIQLEKVKEGFLVTKVGKRENFYCLFL